MSAARVHPGGGRGPVTTERRSARKDGEEAVYPLLQERRQHGGGCTGSSFQTRPKSLCACLVLYFVVIVVRRCNSRCAAH